MAQLLVYNASAGSGKTFNLSKQYIRLLIPEKGQRPAYPHRRILAVTFTNKATEEMKSRIVQNLYELSSGSGKQDWVAEFAAEKGYEEAELRQIFGLLLQQLLHDYGRFNVMTIDSFFQRVLREFIVEHDHKAGFEVRLDTGALLAEALDETLAQLKHQPELLNWLVTFSFQKLDAEKSWQFRQEVLSLGHELVKEEYMAIDRAFSEQGISLSPEQLKAYQSAIRQRMQQYEEQLMSLGQQGVEAIEASGFAAEDFSYGRSGFAGVFYKLAEGNLGPSLTRLDGVLANPEKAAKKSSPQHTEQVAFVQEKLWSTMEAISELLASEEGNYYKAQQQVESNLYTLGVLGSLQDNLRKLRDRERILLNADVPQLIQGIIGGNSAPFLYEKIGQRFEHFLIDEFQDTSPLQWDNFKPLVDNTLGEGHFNLLVGDVKQAIYRFRGGDWHLLLNKVPHDPDLQPYYLPDTLHHNWRSYQRVVDFNNALFQDLSHRLAAALGETENSEAVRAYGNAQQAIHEKRKPGVQGGHVAAKFFTYKKKKEEWLEAMDEQIPEWVESLQDAGFQARDIAFLVETKNKASRLNGVLQEHKRRRKAESYYNYELISPESLQVYQAPVARLLVAGLAFLHRPQDHLSLLRLAFEYRCYLASDEEGPQPTEAMLQPPHTERDALLAELPKAFTDQQDYLRNLPVYEAVERLVEAFGLGAIDGQLPFLQRFQDAVLAFYEEDTQDIGSFLAWWQENAGQFSVQLPEEQNAMRVLTIHQAKGLQFKAVVVPYCEMVLDYPPIHAPMLWVQPQQAPLNQMPFVPVKYSSRLEGTEFEEDYLYEKRSHFLERLNLFYVALTRAEESLTVMAPLKLDKHEQPQPQNSMASLFYQSLTEQEDWQPYFDEAEQCLQWGQLRCYSRQADGPQTEDLETKAVESLEGNYISEEWRRHISIRTQAKNLIAEDEIDSGGLRYGNLVHGLLESITDYRQWQVVLQSAYTAGELSAEQKEQVEAQFGRLFAEPAVCQFFDPQRWNMRSEAPILLPDGSQKRPDRLLTSPGRTVVLDFKTGGPHLTHREQVQGYCQLMQQLGLEGVEGWLLYVTRNSLAQVV